MFAIAEQVVAGAILALVVTGCALIYKSWNAEKKPKGDQKNEKISWHEAKSNTEPTTVASPAPTPSPTRDHLPPLRETLGRAKESVEFLAVSLSHITQQDIDALRGVLLRGIKVTILLLDPEEKVLVDTMQKTTKVDDLVALINKSHRILCQLKNALPLDKRENLVIRKHKMDISESLMIIDSARENDAMIQRENITHTDSPRSRPSRSNSKRNDPIFFEEAYMIYRTAPDDMNSSPYPCDS